MSSETTSGPAPYNPYQPPSADVELGDGFEPSSFEGPYQPWRTIWLQPRKTIRQIVERDPTHAVLLLASLSGIVQALDNATERGLGDQVSLINVVLISCLAGPLGGILGVWIGAALLAWTGRWLRGVGSMRNLRAALAWGTLPAAVGALPLWLLAMAVLGEELFTTATPRLDASPGLAVFLLGFAAVAVVLAVWAVVLTLNTVAEVQHYRSAWRALLNFLLVITVVLLPILLLVMLLGVLVSMA